MHQLSSYAGQACPGTQKQAFSNDLFFLPLFISKNKLFRLSGKNPLLCQVHRIFYNENEIFFVGGFMCFLKSFQNFNIKIEQYFNQTYTRNSHSIYTIILIKRKFILFNILNNLITS
jgi:hypothetical protein